MSRRLKAIANGEVKLDPRARRRRGALVSALVAGDAAVADVESKPLSERLREAGQVTEAHELVLKKLLELNKQLDAGEAANVAVDDAEDADEPHEMYLKIVKKATPDSIQLSGVDETTPASLRKVYNKTSKYGALLKLLDFDTKLGIFYICAPIPNFAPSITAPRASVAAYTPQHTTVFCANNVLKKWSDPQYKRPGQDVLWTTEIETMKAKSAEEQQACAQQVRLQHEQQVLGKLKPVRTQSSALLSYTTSNLIFHSEKQARAAIAQCVCFVVNNIPFRVANSKFFCKFKQ